jgi:hypothetical protein
MVLADLLTAKDGLTGLPPARPGPAARHHAREINSLLTYARRWDDMKDYIELHYPTVHRSYKRLREVVQVVWKSITHERIKELIREMPERCKAVIAANGRYTKY